MGHRRSKTALFFAAQALAVASMIVLLRRDPECNVADCERSSAACVVLLAVAIVGELWILSQALRVDGPVWATVLALGMLALTAAPFAGKYSEELAVSRSVVWVATFWHCAAGVLLIVTGAAAGVWELLGRLRRSDEGAANDRGSSAMWPLE